MHTIPVSISFFKSQPLIKPDCRAVGSGYMEECLLGSFLFSFFHDGTADTCSYPILPEAAFHTDIINTDFIIFHHTKAAAHNSAAVCITAMGYFVFI